MCVLSATENVSEEPITPEGRARNPDDKLLPSEPIKNKDKWPRTPKGMTIVPYVLNEAGFSKCTLALHNSQWP